MIPFGLLIVPILAVVATVATAGYIYYNKVDCPTGTSIENTGGVATGTCKCPGDMVYKNGKCQTCGGTSVYSKGICKECPAGSYSNIGTTSVKPSEGCYCPEGMAFYDNKCAPCPENTVISADGTCKPCDDQSIYLNGTCKACPVGAVSNLRSSVNTNITGCYCPDGLIFENNKCISCGTTAVFQNGVCKSCPPGANTTSTSDPKVFTDIQGCYCPAGSVFKNGQCITCLGGSLVGGQGMDASPLGCSCPDKQIYSNNICIKCNNTQTYDPVTKTCITCPSGAFSTEIGVRAGINGCFCPTGAFYNGTECITCAPGSSGDNIPGSAPATPAGCYCPIGQVFDGKMCVGCGLYAVYDPVTKTCKPCPSTSSTTETGGVTNVNSCRCPAGQVFTKKADGTYMCTPCATGTNTNLSGGKADPLGCFCPDGLVFNTTTKTCQTCETVLPNSYFDISTSQCILCTQGSTPTWTPINAATGCYCPLNSVYKNGVCVLCGGGSSLTGKGATANDPICRCPENQAYSLEKGGCYSCGATAVYSNGVCIDCIGGSTSNNTSAGRVTANTAGCYCDETQVWTGTLCAVCLGGSSKVVTNSIANATGCYCPEGTVYNPIGPKCEPCPITSVYTKGKCILCPSTSTTQGGGAVTNNTSCLCPTGQAYSDVLGCYNCEPKGLFNTVTKTCTPCPGGSSTIVTTGAVSMTGCYCPAGNEYTTTGCSPCMDYTYFAIDSKKCTYCVPIVKNNTFSRNGDWEGTGVVILPTSQGSSTSGIGSAIPIQLSCLLLSQNGWVGQKVSGFIPNHIYAIFVRLSYPPNSLPPTTQIDITGQNFSQSTRIPEINFIPGTTMFTDNKSDYSIIVDIRLNSNQSNYYIKISNLSNTATNGLLIFSVHIIDISADSTTNSCAHPIIYNPVYSISPIGVDYNYDNTGTDIPGWPSNKGGAGRVMNSSLVFNTKVVNPSWYVFKSYGIYNNPMSQFSDQYLNLQIRVDGVPATVKQTINHLRNGNTYFIYVTMGGRLNFTGVFYMTLGGTTLQSPLPLMSYNGIFTTKVYTFKAPNDGSFDLILGNTGLLNSSVLIAGVYIAIAT